MTSLPLVKIGIPTYNNPEGLLRVVNFLMRQPYTNIRIYISDNSEQPCELPKDDRIVYFKQPTNIGLYQNFNYVYNMAGYSDYFMWMSDDDSFHSWYIYECVMFLENYPEYSLCAGDTWMKTKLNIEKPLNTTSSFPFIRMFHYLYRVNRNGIIHGLFRNFGKRQKELPLCPGSDWIWVAKMSLQGKIKNLSCTFMLKEPNGRSANRKQIVDLWAKNKLQAIFFETYTAWHIAKRLPYAPLVFIFLNCKFLFNSIKKRLK